MPDETHELFDVSILFRTVAAAREAWRAVFENDADECVHADGNWNGLAWLVPEPTVREGLDTRLLPETFDLGQASIALKLGVEHQYAVRQMLTNPATGDTAYPDPWTADGLLRRVSVCTGRLLSLGGFAVVLHGAGRVVKSADMFREELGNPSDLQSRPYEAWLDLIAIRDEDEDKVECRSFGMPRYFGAPDVFTTFPGFEADDLELAMGAVRHVCAEVAAWNDSPFKIKVAHAPAFRVAGRPLPAVDWRVAYEDEDSRLVLSRDG